MIMARSRRSLFWMTAAAWSSRPFMVQAKRTAYPGFVQYSLATDLRRRPRHPKQQRAALGLPSTKLWLSSTKRSKSKDDDQSVSKLDHEQKEEDDRIAEETLQWVQRAVIGMNLCPFAERPFREKKLKIDVLRGNDEHELLTLILAEMLVRVKQPGTTLIVAPECYPDDFEKYLDFVNMIEKGLMVDHDELIGAVQVAPFHPLFQFEGSDVDSPDNWTNRSPYPIFHVLREEEVTKAVDYLDGDAGKVWKRNVDLLETISEELGSEKLASLMVGGASDDDDDKSKLSEILRRFKLKISRPVKDNTEID